MPRVSRENLKAWITILQQINVGCHSLFSSRPFININANLCGAKSISCNPELHCILMYPPAHSVLSDFVGKEQKSYATSFFSIPLLYFHFPSLPHLPSTSSLPSTLQTEGFLHLEEEAKTHVSICVLKSPL